MSTADLPHVRAVRGLAAAALLAPAAPAAALTTTEWLGQPRAATGALAPPGFAADGTPFALTGGVTLGGGWDRRALGAAGWGAPAPAQVPAGMSPVATGADGAVLAMGPSVEGASVVVRSAVWRGGAWTPVAAVVSGGASPTYTGALGADGTVVVAATDGATLQLGLQDGARVRGLTAKGSSLPRLAVDEAGDALAVWKVASGSRETALYSVLPAGRGWTGVRRAPVPRSVPVGALSVDADLSAGGVGMMAWTARSAGRHRVWWSMSPAIGTPFTPAAPAAPAASPGAVLEGIRMSGPGDATVVWSTPRATLSASRLAGAPWWTTDGTVAGAPGSGRATHAPVEVVADRFGTVGVSWATHDGVAISRKGHGPGPWPAAPDAVATAPGPLSVRAALSPGGGTALSWIVDSGVGNGRAGVAARPGAPALVARVTVRRTRRAVQLTTTATRPGPVVIAFTRRGARTPDATMGLVVNAGVTRFDATRLAETRLNRRATYTVAALGTGASPTGDVPKAVLRGARR